jgi:release factor glutamine methyltransferase
MATIRDALVMARASLQGDDAALESEVLLAHVLGIHRTRLLASYAGALAADARERYAALVDRRRAGEPLAYIVGRREFYGLDLACAPGALIPRPETELLVEFALEHVGRIGAGARVADVGTGSGAIAVAVAVHAPAARITAIDAAEGALDIARRNAHAHGVAGRLELRHGDLLDATGTFDVIVANLPYVPASAWASLAPEIRLHEPKDALVPGPGGTEAIERLLEQAPRHLAARGALAMETGSDQAQTVLVLAARRFPDADRCVIKDFGGLDRVVTVTRKDAHGLR